MAVDAGQVQSKEVWDEKSQESTNSTKQSLIKRFNVNQWECAKNTDSK